MRSLGMACHAACRSSTRFQGKVRTLNPRKKPWKPDARERSTFGFFERESTSTGRLMSLRMSTLPRCRARSWASGSLMMTR